MAGRARFWSESWTPAGGSKLRATSRVDLVRVHFRQSCDDGWFHQVCKKENGQKTNKAPSVSVQKCAIQHSGNSPSLLLQASNNDSGPKFQWMYSCPYLKCVYITHIGSIHVLLCAVCPLCYQFEHSTARNDAPVQICAIYRWILWDFGVIIFMLFNFWD